MLPQTRYVCKVQQFAFVASRADWYQRSMALAGDGRLELQGMRWKSGQVRIKYKTVLGGWKTMPVEALICGPFAIHPEQFRFRSEGSILTHTHTGMVIIRVPSLVAAKEVAESIRDLDWNFATRDRMPKSTRKAMKKRWQTLKDLGTANEQPPGSPAPAGGNGETKS
jgi:hypothetical protein